MNRDVIMEGDLQMEEELMQDEFTFKKVWELLKASAVRIVVFCVIAAIIMGIISAVVLTTTKKTREQITAVITYAHAGIEEGKAPDGTLLNVNRIRSPQIVSLAINAYNAQSANANKIDVNNLTAITQNIEVNGHLPSNILSQIEFQTSLGANADTTLLKELLDTYPSQYSVTIKNVGATGLTNNQAVALINEILVEYIKDFKETYGSPALLESMSAPVLSNDSNESYEFIELYSIYDQNITKALNYLNSHASQNALFRSVETGKTFRDIADELSFLQQSRLFQLGTYILQNALTNDPSYTVEYLLTLRRQNLQNQKNAKDNASSIFKVIEEYSNGHILTSVGPNGELVLADGGPTATYNSLVNQHNAYIAEAVRYGSVAAEVEAKLKYYADFTVDPTTNEILNLTVKNIATTNTEANKNKAKELSRNLVEQVNNVFEVANQTAVEYYDKEYMKDAVNITMPAASLVETTSQFRLMLIISAAVVFLTAIAAIITTHTVLASKKRKVTEATA